ncbi:MAG TPA: LytTR family DNA-binding domain-containing protein [Flavisolibacter sp.]|nr:LytTR family DNA-binding domain-containing protein [Flavisolibacter sp.]
MNSVDADKKLRRRLIVRRGIEWIALKSEDIALIYTESKVVYVLDHLGNKYICDKPLFELEATLDQAQFFRANRQYIINIDFIRVFKPFEKVKLQVEILIANNVYKITISQENAPQFKKWIYEL